MVDHQQIISLVIAYTLAGAVVFTVVITCLTLVGWVRLADENQQKKLFYILIVEVIGISVSFFGGFLRYDPVGVQRDIIRDANSVVLQKAWLDKTPPYITPFPVDRMIIFVQSCPVVEGTDMAYDLERLTDYLEEHRDVMDEGEIQDRFRDGLFLFQTLLEKYLVTGEWEGPIWAEQQSGQPAE